MAEFPALMLWTDAYLADTGHLTTIEHGAYLLLLMAMWRNDGWLPNDDKLLARYARLTPCQWKRVRSVIMGFMDASSDRITQSRLTDELSAVKQVRESRKTSAKARWLKKRETGRANASAKPVQNDAIPTNIHNTSTNVDVARKRAPLTDLLEYEFSEDDRKLIRERGHDPDRIIRRIKDWATNAAPAKRRKRDVPAFIRNWCDGEKPTGKPEDMTPGKPIEVPECWRSTEYQKAYGRAGPALQHWLRQCQPAKDGESLVLETNGFIGEQLRGRYAVDIEKLWPGPVIVRARAA